jgi:hypothetical protein
MALGQHLGSNQDARATRSDFIQFVREAAFSARAIAIDSGNANIRELFPQEILDSLRSLTNRNQLFLTSRTMIWNSRAIIAMVATQLTVGGVDSHSCITAATTGYPTALRAKQSRRKTPSVQEQ